MKNNWRCLTKTKHKFDSIMINHKNACCRTTNELDKNTKIFEGFNPADIVKWNRDKSQQWTLPSERK